MPPQLTLPPVVVTIIVEVPALSVKLVVVLQSNAMPVCDKVIVLEPRLIVLAVLAVLVNPTVVILKLFVVNVPFRISILDDPVLPLNASCKLQPPPTP